MSGQDDNVEIGYVPDDDFGDDLEHDITNETNLKGHDSAHDSDDDSDHDSVHDSDDDSDHDDDGAAKKKKLHSKKHRLTIKKLQSEVDRREELMNKVIAERDEYKEKYLRNLAEIDNFRKRVKKEKEDYQKYVLGEFLLELLTVYDNQERALKAAMAHGNDAGVVVSEGEKSIISGVQMIHKLFSDLLKKYNVMEIEAEGQPFDPNFHQALSKEEVEGVLEPTVQDVYQKGFTYNGKLLKPTLVKVAVPMEEEEEPEDIDEDNTPAPEDVSGEETDD